MINAKILASNIARETTGDQAMVRKTKGDLWIPRETYGDQGRLEET